MTAPVNVSSTTGLEGRNQSEVNAALRRLSEGRTTILITHHLAAVSQVDRVVRLHERQMVGEGTHEELMARNGRYDAAYRLQVAENDSAARLYAEA